MGTMGTEAPAFMPCCVYNTINKEACDQPRLDFAGPSYDLRMQHMCRPMKVAQHAYKSKVHIEELKARCPTISAAAGAILRL